MGKNRLRTKGGSEFPDEEKAKLEQEFGPILDKNKAQRVPPRHESVPAKVHRVPAPMERPRGMSLVEPWASSPVSKRMAMLELPGAKRGKVTIA